MAAPGKGQRHRLVLYTYTVNHWWRVILGIGIVLVALVASLTWLPGFLPDYSPIRLAPSVTWLSGGVGIFSLLLGVFLFSIRRSAYVQPFATQLRLVTPFLRMNISYRRIKQASSTDMARLFPLNDYRGSKREFLRPLSRLTAIVLELNGWPLPRSALNLFLSPFFFPDRSARIALLVPDWIRFSTDLESHRSEWLDSLRNPGDTAQMDLLASLSMNKQ